MNEDNDAHPGMGEQIRDFTTYLVLAAVVVATTYVATALLPVVWAWRKVRRT